ncbi:MAG: hypothetical protein V4478_04010 [Patescibacteria group bacterium]
MNEGAPKPPENLPERNQASSFETAKGSEYRYLEDGRTQRFKKVENKEYDPQDVMVFIPDWQTLEAKASPQNLAALGGSENEYQQILLKYAQEMKVYVVDENFNKINSNQEAASVENTFIALCKTSDSAPDYVIPVSIIPKENYQPYDTTKYLDETSGEWKREQHIGNKIVKINYD